MGWIALSPTPSSTFVSAAALSVEERDRLAARLAGLPSAEAWSTRHMHGALLCVLGLVDPPDAAYARAADRRFADLVATRRRALALLEELDSSARAQQYERRHRRDGRPAA
jgi:hypothetical protein